MINRVVIITFFLFTIYPMISHGHRPTFPKKVNTIMERSYVIKNFDIAQVIYGTIKQENLMKFYAIDGKKGDSLFLQLLLPKISNPKDFKPNLIIVGPGLPKRDGEPPVNLNSDEGWVSIDFERSKDFFESFTQTSYIMEKKSRISLPQSGRYHIVVHCGDSKSGKYTLAIGEKETWGPRDILKFPSYWFRTRIWYNPVSTLAVLAVPITAILYVLVRRG